MKHMLQICCKNNNISKEFPIGSSLLDIYYGFNLNFPYQVVSAKVNNRCPFPLLHSLQSCQRAVSGRKTVRRASGIQRLLL